MFIKYPHKQKRPSHCANATTELTRHLIQQAACKQFAYDPYTTVYCPPMMNLLYTRFPKKSIFQLFNELRYFNEMKAQYVAFQRSGDRGKAQSLGNGKENALQSLRIRPVLG